MGESIEYQGAQMATVIWVPKDAVKLKVKAKCKDGTKMEMVLDEEGIKECRNDYLSVDPYDGALAMYTFNPLFEQFLKDGGSFDAMNEWDNYRRIHEKGREE